MKTKSLVLGAHPPFEGPWVSLEGADEWKVKVVGGDEDAVGINIKVNGGPTKILRFKGKEISAGRVRVCLSPSENGTSVSVFIESV